MLSQPILQKSNFLSFGQSREEIHTHYPIYTCTIANLYIQTIYFQENIFESGWELINNNSQVINIGLHTLAQGVICTANVHKLNQFYNEALTFSVQLIINISTKA